MRHIKSTLETLDVDRVGEAVFYTTWDPRSFAEEMDESQSLGSMITFTGTVDLAWATSSKEYVEEFWPETGVRTLKAIEKVMKSNRKNLFFQDTRGIQKVAIPDDEALTEMYVRGSKSEIVQTAQQLAWMMSAFQTQNFTDSPKRIYSQFRIKDLGKNKYILEQSPLSEAPNSIASCWLPMLHGSVIAQGFPTPPRGIEKGVEMSLAAIKILAGVKYPVYLEGVTFLRGWSTLLYPVRASKDFSSVQWHMVESDNPDDERLKPNKQSVNVSNWNDVGLDSLRKLRSFVGYCSNANIHVGTESFDVQVPEEKSGASSVKSRWLWGNKITVSIASSGMGAAGPEFGGEIGLHKKARASLIESTDFSKVLVRSAETPVVMYDVSAGTGWLVPEINVALHIARSWLLERGDLAKAEKSQIPLAPVGTDGGRAARRTIRNNREHKLKCADEDLSWSFYDTVKDSVRLLRACRETQVREESSESGAWLTSWFHAPRLYGWDIADLVEGRESTPRKEVTIRKNPKTKWLTAIANHPDVLVLFCNSIQAPIQPVDPATICRKWNPMPGGENYLVASVRSLKALANYCNGSPNLRKLADHCYWIQPLGNDPWGPCDFKSKHGCDRMQQLGDGSSNRTTKICEDGAVIFGELGPPAVICRRPKHPKSSRRESISSSVPMKSQDKVSNGENLQVGSARAKTAKRKPQKVYDDEDEDSSSEESSSSSIRPNTSRTKKSQQQRKNAVNDDKDDLSSQAPSDAEHPEEKFSESDTDESATSNAETLEQDGSDTRSNTVRDDSTEENPGAKRLLDEKFREEEDTLLKAIIDLEWKVKEGLKLYEGYYGKVEQKQAVKALFDEMSGIIDSTREKLDL